MRLQPSSDAILVKRHSRVDPRVDPRVEPSDASLVKCADCYKRLFSLGFLGFTIFLSIGATSTPTRAIFGWRKHEIKGRYRLERDFYIESSPFFVGIAQQRGNMEVLIDPSMEMLPAELTIDIFSRLPFKTIIHCKLTLPMLTSISLDHLHLRISISSSIMSLYADYKNPGKLQLMEIEDKVDHHHLHYHHLFILDLNLVPMLKKTRIRHVGSVNGLICLWQYSLNLDYTKTNIIIKLYIKLTLSRDDNKNPNPILAERVGQTLSGYETGIEELTGIFSG
ncbi:hypothetical protein OSB04_020775 [Centaurea solstitialis]|uniref:Uncharacterized protein n=1 Tax=Centaurea solstitialis TaxID=347529 RepID=A0AA38TBC2_9ASTR|nr:hypothetical protein OSB04_020775 [Centaurea solstitialis]